MLRTVLALVVLLIGSPVSAELVTFAAIGERQQTLTIYSSTDTERMIDLIDAFQQRNPGIAVAYHLLDTLDIYGRAVTEMDNGKPTADLFLSSAMDLQIKIVANTRYVRSM